MTKPRRSRHLSSEERALWALVARTTQPLPGRRLPEMPALPSVAPTTELGSSAPAPPRTGSKASRPSIAALAPLERKTLTALRRRRRTVDGFIDLHGMRQDEAHAALLGFLRRSQAAGHDLVLVVTGKGAASSGASAHEERGVLRRTVPHWLRLPDLRPIVLGVEEALPHHGGAGALYVRLRRRRS